MRGNSELPSGVVTFVFTDIEGSTQLFRKLGDAFPSLLERHNELLREMWAKHDGAEVKTEGDAFFVAFSDPGNAVRACVEAVECLESESWPAEAAIRIRAGMHTGVGYPREGDYIAFPVHQAARIGAVGNGGQVVVSPTTVELLGTVEGVNLHDLGSFRVRDFDDAIHLYQAERSTDPTTHPALRAQADVQHNMPRDLPNLIGRRDDLAGVRDQMRQSRLVSLLGPGGVGKTLLALTVASHEVGNFSDGVWFVDLTSHRDGSTIRGALADVLRVGSEEIEDHIRSKQMLIVFDNCEQASGPTADLVTRLLDACGDVTFLITSREPLGVTSERLWRLEPFSGRTSAVELFVTRALAVFPGFDPVPDVEAIATLCKRLDGLPLAIELAAARITVMSPTEILSSLDDQLRVLRSRRRDLNPRQRTATGLVDWSYQLLDEDEQLVLRRIGVFRSSFTTETATAVAGDTGLDFMDTADIIWSLAEKSLIMPVAVHGGTRYRLLETTRAFARTKLEELGELVGAEIRLGEWYCARFNPTGPIDAEKGALLADEIENVRGLAADLVTENSDVAQTLVWICGVHYLKKDLNRGLAELEPLVRQLKVPGASVIGMLATFGLMKEQTEDFEGLAQLVEEAETLIAASSEPLVGTGWLVNAQALAEVRRGNFEAALSLVNGALDDAIELEQMTLLGTAGIAAAEMGDIKQAGIAFRGLLERARSLGSAATEAIVLGNIAEVESRLGNTIEAASLTGNTLQLCAEMGMRSQQGFALIGAARMVGSRQQWRDAVVLHRAGERLLEETGLVLFATDKQISDALMRDALDGLGLEEYAHAAQLGTELNDAAATTHALDLLDTFVAKSSALG